MWLVFIGIKYKLRPLKQPGWATWLPRQSQLMNNYEIYGTKPREYEIAWYQINVVFGFLL